MIPSLSGYVTPQTEHLKPPTNFSSGGLSKMSVLLSDVQSGQARRSLTSGREGLPAALLFRHKPLIVPPNRRFGTLPRRRRSPSFDVTFPMEARLTSRS